MTPLLSPLLSSDGADSVSKIEQDYASFSGYTVIIISLNGSQ